MNYFFNLSTHTHTHRSDEPISHVQSAVLSTVSCNETSPFWGPVSTVQRENNEWAELRGAALYCMYMGGFPTWAPWLQMCQIKKSKKHSSFLFVFFKQESTLRRAEPHAGVISIDALHPSLSLSLSPPDHTRPWLLLSHQGALNPAQLNKPYIALLFFTFALLSVSRSDVDVEKPLPHIDHHHPLFSCPSAGRGAAVQPPYASILRY